MSTPYFPPNASGDPRQMPELRRGLLDLCNHPGWAQAEYLRVLNEFVGNPVGISSSLPYHVDEERGQIIVQGPTGYSGDELRDLLPQMQERVEAMAEWYRETLQDAQLIHVTAELCDVLFSSLNSMPDDRVLERTDPPTPAGLCVFEQPFMGIDSGDEFEQVRVDGVAWGPVRLPPRDRYGVGVTEQDLIRPGYAIAAFRRFADEPMHALPVVVPGDDWGEQHDFNPSLARSWAPLGRADWAIGSTIDDTVHDAIIPGSKTHLSMVEDRKLIAALWALIAQKRIVESTTVEPPREVRKRLDRAGDTTTRSVEVIHLRRAEYRPTRSDEPTGRKVRVRYAVRPFWRNQPYGPASSLRKLILIPAHMRGPDDAPLSNVERVWEVDR